MSVYYTLRKKESGDLFYFYYFIIFIIPSDGQSYVSNEREIAPL